MTFILLLIVAILGFLAFFLVGGYQLFLFVIFFLVIHAFCKFLGFLKDNPPCDDKKAAISQFLRQYETPFIVTLILISVLAGVLLLSSLKDDKIEKLEQQIEDLKEDIHAEYYDEGYLDGYQDGYSEGEFVSADLKEAIAEDSYLDGYSNGYDNGYGEGYIDGVLSN